MGTRALAELSELGVAVWLDDLSRDLLRSGGLADLIENRQVVGVTTNPSIIAKALSVGTAYNSQLRDCALRGTDVGETLRTIECTDVWAACDVLRPVFVASGGRDGRVSIQVDPRINTDPDRTLAEARALWWMVDRPKLFIKIPAVPAGLPAVPAALAEGISVNVTLIFSAERLRPGARRPPGRPGTPAGRRAERGRDRVGRLVLRQPGGHRDRPPAGRARRRRRAGRGQRDGGPGAARARPLWASIGVKDPAYDDTRYVVELAAPGTVNTMPAGTLAAVADHGTARGDTISGNAGAARAVLAGLAKVGVDLQDVVAAAGPAVLREGLDRSDRDHRRPARGVRRAGRPGRQRASRRLPRLSPA